ncbi:sugar phosphate isomerase/epimerase family protein [Luteolibacter luteus]|uniref:Sugar phosphate isomerase/epimerase n=1 Tax=Luteolibacter luteus TaxID=2728835 RepID=A0A858RQS9_9BACT|nr:sugar phosphate isomerase/epimerase [Luteolibacter luteus]QJE98699.1 sugar phosphate isomerase/epimerase [Luteolibacter luteus]
MDRRNFIARTALAVSSSIAAPALAAESATAGSRPYFAFTKTLEKLPFDELATKIAALGVAGLEAPIRKGGHIEPNEAGEKLPLFVEALKKHNLKLGILTTDIVKADKESEQLLRTAAGLGVKQYRLGPYFYDLKKPIAPQVANVAAALKDLAAMNKDIGMQAQFQNHRGNNRVGSPIWDVLEAMEGIDPAQLGLAFDFAHATVEGVNAWELNLRRAAPQVVAVYFKDYQLSGSEQTPCPLGEGAVGPRSAKVVKEILPPNTPISLHVEYIPDGKDRTERTLEAMKKDFATLDKWLA